MKRKHGERLRLIFFSSVETYIQPTVAGTLGETLEANSKYGTRLDENHADKMERTVEAARHADLVRKLEWKPSLAKMQKAERVLGKVETALRPTEHSRPETLTDEERFMFRKLGLRMKAFLLLGVTRKQSLEDIYGICPILLLHFFSLLLPQIVCLFNPSFFLFLVADEQRH